MARNNSDRFQKGAEMLGNGDLAVRLAGLVYLVELVEATEEVFARTTLEVLTAHLQRISSDHKKKIADNTGSGNITSDEVAERLLFPPEGISVLRAIAKCRNELLKNCKTSELPPISEEEVISEYNRGTDRRFTISWGIDYYGKRQVLAQYSSFHEFFADSLEASGKFIRLDFSHFSFTHASFRLCWLTGSSFENSVLNATDFTGSLLNEVNFKGAALRNAKFVNSSLRCSDFSGASLRGADFTGADLTDVKGLLDAKGLTLAQMNEVRSCNVDILQALAARETDATKQAVKEFSKAQHD